MRKFLTICCLLSLGLNQAVFADDGVNELLRQGQTSCKNGSYFLALSQLQKNYTQSLTPQQKTKSAGALGLVLAQMRRFALAEPLLQEAFDSETDSAERAQYAVDLGNLQQERGMRDAAKNNYRTALMLAPDVPQVVLSVGLNSLVWLSTAEQSIKVQALSSMLDRVQDPQARARFSINLAVHAKALGLSGRELAFRTLLSARALAEQSLDQRLVIEAIDQLAQLYEEGGRFEDALKLSEHALLAAQSIVSHDLLIQIEWRRGRILQQMGQIDTAIPALQHAVNHIQAIRQDIPVEYQNGRSSFRDTLEPVYLMLADLLLQKSASLQGEQQRALLYQARDTLELIKQSELDDYLGDRCSSASVQTKKKKNPIATKTAILYPIIFPQRLDLLIETSAGIERRSVNIDAREFRRDVTNFAAALRGAQSYQTLSKKLYKLILLPLDEVVDREQIDTLVMVPDGVLRLLPLAALHDGQRFAIQKYAIAVAPGLNMTDTQGSARSDGYLQALLAGVSEPGAVVGKLPEELIQQLLAGDGLNDAASDSAQARGVLTRGVHRGKTEAELGNVKTPALASRSPGSLNNSQRDIHLKKILSLAGVDDEINSLKKLLPASILLNQTFTLAAFAEQVKTGNFPIVHIASHGIFGSSAENTFIMAHDDLITVDKLQSFLGSAKLRASPIELLILSACETAEGDDRAPMGLSGAALKARAKSALGSLWPVSDEASTIFMNQFYVHLVQNKETKALAMQAAQLELMKNPTFAHPAFWAPFIVVGNWL